jgi:hypothetical protein
MNTKEAVMRHLFITICLSLLLSSVTFASEKISCVNRIPNSSNFIISGAVFYQTIRCLEDLIETRHASTIAAISTQTAITHKKDDQDDDDLICGLSVRLIAKPNEKKILMLSFNNPLQKKTFELALN